MEPQVPFRAPSEGQGRRDRSGHVSAHPAWDSRRLASRANAPTICSPPMLGTCRAQRKQKCFDVGPNAQPVINPVGRGATMKHILLLVSIALPLVCGPNIAMAFLPGVPHPDSILNQGAAPKCINTCRARYRDCRSRSRPHCSNVETSTRIAPASLVMRRDNLPVLGRAVRAGSGGCRCPSRDGGTIGSCRSATSASGPSGAQSGCARRRDR